MNLKPFLHEHHLVYDKYEKQEGCCDRCNQQIDGWAFTCETCKFWLHRSCAVKQLPLEISHPLHSEHPLKLVTEKDDDSSHFFCNGCSSLTRSCLYRCADCNFNLDHICASSTTITSHGYKEIPHFCHFHSLTRFKYRKVSKYHYSCFWCEKLLSRVSYGCFKCPPSESFVHETCLINIPNIISKHHFHSSHQLQLIYWYSVSPFSCDVCGYRTRYAVLQGYICEKCQFLIHISCAKFKPSLKHELHDHSLILLPTKSSSIYQELDPCKKCSEEIRPSKDSVFNCYYYRCVLCGFNFHLRCLIPLSIKHKYHRHELMFTDVFLEDYSDHYYCDICEEERNAYDPVYCCNKCTFTAHIGCALNEIKDEPTYNLVGDKDSTGKLMEEDEINERNANFSPFEIMHCERGHELMFDEDIERGARCYACWLEISDGAYACKRCRYYYIHKTCIRLPSQVLHPLHPQHSLKLNPRLSARPRSYLICQGCRSLNPGFAYICYACDFKLDVKCATSSWVPKNETQRLKDMETQSKLCLFNHHHELGYFVIISDLLGYENCGFCGLNILGPVFQCSECEYSLHERCVGIIPLEMQIQFHPLHPLHLLFNPSQPCRVCKGSFEFQKISYGCVQCDDLYLHADCAKSLKRVLKSKSHTHRLYYFGSEPYGYEFKVCGECNHPIGQFRFCFCMECDTKFHIECVLPRSLKSKYHIHPLTLTRKDGFEEDDSGEYYCDICEEEREATYHAYHCTKCRGGTFVAHISCALDSEEEIAASSNLALDSCPFEAESESKISKDEFKNEVSEAESENEVSEAESENEVSEAESENEVSETEPESEVSEDE